MKLTNKKAILVLALLCSIFFYDIILHPTDVFLGGDMKDLIITTYEYREDSFDRYEQIPFWDTFKYSGAFSMLTITHYYPTDFLFILYFESYFINFFMLIHVFLAGVFTYCFARSLKLNKYASLVSGVIYMFSGSVIMRIANSTSTMASIALIPLNFLMLKRLIDNPNIKNSIFLGLTLALQIFAGEFNYFFYASIGLGLFFLFSIFTSKQNKTKIILFPALSLLIGLSISSIYLIPSLEFTTYLNRIDGNLMEGSGYEYTTSAGSLPLPQMITSIMPFAFGDGWQGIYWGAPEQSELYFYLGIFPLLLALLSLLFVRNKYTWFFFGLAVFALLFSLGKYTPFFYILFKIVPGVNLFRIPSKMMVLYSLSIAIMSGFGVSYLLNKIKAKDKKILKNISKGLFWITTLSFIAVVLTFLFKTQIISFGENMLHTMYYQTYVDSIFVQRHSYESLLILIESAYNIISKAVLSFSIFVLLTLLLFYLRVKDKISRNKFKVLLIILLFSDVAFFGIGIHSTSFGSSDNLIENKEVLEFLNQDDTLYRVLVTDQREIFSQYASVKYNIQQFLGKGSSRLTHFDTFLKDGLNIVDPTHSMVKWGSLTVPANLTNHSYSSKLLGMMNVKYLVSLEALNNKDFIFVNKLNDIYIYENKKLLPRAFVVPEAKFVDDPASILNKMKLDYFNPKDIIILEKQIKIKESKTKQDYKEAKIAYYSPNKITIKVETDSPSFLVLSEVWYPGWKAYDNGKELEIYKTNYVIRSVYLDEGQHNVEFVYDSIYFKIGKTISILTLVFILAFLFIFFYKKQSK